jgi:protein-S-isoprenylcysteine O-methyltransferase Ste14
VLILLLLVALTVILLATPLTAGSVLIAACWGTGVVVWIVGAFYNARLSGAVRNRSPLNKWVGVSAVVVIVLIAVVPVDWHRTFDVPTWVQMLGGLILIGSTAFTMWARLRLGRMWSSMAVEREDHELRSDGPFAVTRHPIYTGIIGMLLGTTLLSGETSWLAALIAGIVILETKAIVEERLLLTVFPDEYPRYRKRVPQMIPIPRLRSRRAS